MMRSTAPLCSVLLLLVAACGSDRQRPAPRRVDCSVTKGYEFSDPPIANFNKSGDAGWFRYVDPTPGGIPDAEKLQVENPIPPDEGSNVYPTDYKSKRCNEEETLALRLEAEGHNFWGAGFGNYDRNADIARAVGADEAGVPYEGISFWARSERDSEKSFIFNVDDGRTIVNPPDVCRLRLPEDTPPECQTATDTSADADAGADLPALEPPEPPEGGWSCTSEFGLLPIATDADQDLDGDGCIGPGDIVSGTQCRLPPPEDVGDAACYNGGVNQPSSAGTRVPEANECGNQFHTLINTSETWQLFLIPWKELQQWPCPNRLSGGIDFLDIAKFEIKFLQGTRYKLWIDNIAFYRRK